MWLSARVIATLLVGGLLVAPTARAQIPSLPGEPSMFNLEHVFNFDPGGSPYAGTDLAFWTATVPLRDYETGQFVDEQGHPVAEPLLVERDFSVMGNTGANAGGYVFDITDPADTQLVTNVECAQVRNDPSVVKTTDAAGNERVLLILGDEEGDSPTCLRGLRRIGDPHGSGISVFDVTDPFAWEPLYSVEAEGGAHTATAHPTKPFVSMSTGDFPGALAGDIGFNHIPIVDFTDPDEPELTAVQVRLGGPHNVEFSPDGTRAYVANENHYEIWDTTDPGNPTLISDTTVNNGTYAHGAWGTPQNDIMVTNNESLALGGFFVGGTGICPGEGLTFYDVAGENAANPIPLGYFDPPLVGRTDERACTSHFGNIAPNGSVMTVGWYIGGARVVDFSNPSAPVEVAHAVMADAESWTAKTYKGPYVYVGDIVRGFDVFRWTGDGAAPWQQQTATGATTTVQPGVSIQTGDHGCTLNWIYNGTGSLDGKVFGGTAGHCVDEVGQSVSLTTGTFGDPISTIGEVAYIDDNLDYAFIEIDQANHHLVNPSLKGHPQIPTGVSTTSTAAIGDIIQFSGHGTGFHAHEVTREQRKGILSHNDGTQHYVYTAVSPGDSGGPVADVTDGNKALGIVNTGGAGLSGGLPHAGEGGVSLEGMLADAAEAGFTLTVRTVS